MLVLGLALLALAVMDSTTPREASGAPDRGERAVVRALRGLCLGSLLVLLAVFLRRGELVWPWLAGILPTTEPWRPLGLTWTVAWLSRRPVLAWIGRPVEDDAGAVVTTSDDGSSVQTGGLLRDEDYR